MFQIKVWAVLIFSISREGKGVNSNFHWNTGFIMIAPAIHFLIAVFIHSICHPQTCTCFTVSDTTRFSHTCAHEHTVFVWPILTWRPWMSSLSWSRGGHCLKRHENLQHCHLAPRAVTLFKDEAEYSTKVLYISSVRITIVPIMLLIYYMAIISNMWGQLSYSATQQA